MDLYFHNVGLYDENAAEKHWINLLDLFKRNL